MLFTCSDNQKAAFDFKKLECLRLFCRQIRQDQVASLKYFEYEVGYQHYRGKNKISVSSSATCVLSLVATDSWKADKAKTKALLRHLISKETSAGLPKKNPFTIAWILEAVTALEDYSEPLDPREHDLLGKMEQMLQKEIKGGGGGVKIKTYPPSAYLTHLVVRTLRRRKKLNDELQDLVNKWAWAELTRQLALIQAKSKTADAFAVAYLLMLVPAVTPSSKTDPEQTSIQRAALETFFDCQLHDGTWPLSRPLFHYEKFGNAHCYEYEMLTQLLQQPELQDLLLDYLPNLSSAAESVSNSVYRVEHGVQAWTSGHHPQLVDPESWATASVYHFVYSLDRLLAEAVRRELFRSLESPFSIPSERGSTKADFAKEVLDSTVNVRGELRGLKDFLWEDFVEPLNREVDGIAKGRIFDKRTSRSAIFFGPPGTSKTELSKEIAKFLGWPHLAIDPSHLLRNGMDGIQAEANAIFRMLEETERVVVLFDEFDELVRERGSSKAEPFSRFLTTAMLPKLANIRKRGTLVFIIATNNIGDFDLAIRRPGRFDLLVQIMPPTFEAKMTKSDWGLAGKLATLGAALTDDIKKKIEDLTFGECEEFAADLAKVVDRQDVAPALNNRWNHCTLQTKVSQEDTRTWRDRCQADSQQFNR
jgi:ATPase family associated with various cellular activities (AAA)